MTTANVVSVILGGSALLVWVTPLRFEQPSLSLILLAAALLLSSLNVLLPLAAAPLSLAHRAHQDSIRRIEEQRHQSELLAAEKAQLEITVESISDGVITSDRDGGVTLINHNARQLAMMHEDARPGRPVDAVFAAAGLPASMYAPALQQVAGGTAIQLRSDVHQTNERLIELTGRPTHDPRGRVAGAVWILRDLTDAVRAEHERAKAARLESLGILAGGLAHDFNNILTGILGNVSLAAESIVHDDNVTARLNDAINGCARAGAVTNQLLTFAKGGAPVKTAASLDDLVTECTRFALAGSPVAPRFSIAPDLWGADVDTGQIGRVVHNLVINAMQSMPRGGYIDVSLENVGEDMPLLEVLQLPSGPYVALTVRDSGIGIPDDVIDQIFDPYFSTKERGNGLGLAISYSIVKAHGGAISATSQAGVGSEFTVFLPAATILSPPPEGTRHETVSRGARGRALVMDDDAAVAEVCQNMLEALGYTAMIAPSGGDAVAQFQQAEDAGDPFDITILDLTIPGGMSGSEAVGHIRRIRPDALVFVASGYSDDPVLSRFRDYGFDGVLPKPFTIADLRDTIATAPEHAWT